MFLTERIKKGRLRRILIAVACLFIVPLLLFWLWAEFSACPHPMAGLDFSRVICDRDGTPMRIGLTKDEKYRIRTRLEDIPKEAIDSVIRYEDRWFWKHPGVNIPALARAGLAMARGGRVMGGSTLTMQVARLTLGLRTGSLRDKLLQIAYAFKLERHFSKAQILECYFNMAPYGGNVEGLAAASMVYFHKAPSRLTPSESMTLMLVPQNPVARRPSQGNSKLARSAARLQEQWTGETEHAPLRIYSVRELPFFCPHLSGELLVRKDIADNVYTTIDRRQQSLLEQHLARFVARGKAVGLNNAAALLVHWPTREIRALVGSANFNDSSISGQIDGTRARRSPGSTLKPAIYALALDQGLIHPKTLLADMPRSFSGYDPENFDSSFRGPLHADEALRLSRNLPALTLAARLAPPGLFGFLGNAGFAFEKTEEHYGLSLVLGGAEVTMRELAALYAALPNGGVWQPLAFTKIESAAPQGQKQLLSPEACFLVLDMLVAESEELSARSHGKKLPLRVKTGTSNGFRDAWAAGIVGPYVLVIWVGNFDNASSPLLVGGKTALPLFCEVARGLAAREPMQDRLAIPSPALNVDTIHVCSATGDVDTSLCPGALTETWFIPGVSPVRPTGILRSILIDKASGMRACMAEDGKTEEIPWEFWPSDFRRQFLRAGIVKPEPPPYLPECPQAESTVPGPAPDIALPKAGLVYHVTLAGGEQPIALMAHAAAGIKTLFWFSNGSFIGKTKPGEMLTYSFSPGEHLLRVTDDSGRTSVRRLTVNAVK